MRKRSVSIYAKSKEEYMENINKGKKTRNNFEDENEYENLGYLKPGNELSVSEDLETNFTHQLKVDTKTAEEEEKELIDQLESINNLYKSFKKEIRVTGKEGLDLSIDNGFNLLCSFFKENIRTGRTQRDPQLLIHQSNKKFPRSMSNNSITDISVKDILDSIVKFNKEEDECENKNDSKNVSDTSSGKGGNTHGLNFKGRNSFKKNSVENVSHQSCNSNSSWSTQLSNELLAQNLECEEEVLKVMMIGSTHIGKTHLIDSFLEFRRNRYEPSSGLEIKKKIVKIIDKNVRIEFYDTDANFHLKDTSKIYYKLCDAFFYVVDWSKQESVEFISNIHENIFNNSTSNSFFLANLNLRSKNSKVCDEKLKSFADDLNAIYVPLEDVSNFHMKNNTVVNVFSYVLVKKIKNKNKTKFKKNLTLSEENSNFDKIHPCMGYDQNYKLDSYVKLNNQISLSVKRKLRHSDNNLIKNV